MGGSPMNSAAQRHCARAGSPCHFISSAFLHRARRASVVAWASSPCAVPLRGITRAGRPCYFISSAFLDRARRASVGAWASSPCAVPLRGFTRAGCPCYLLRIARRSFGVSCPCRLRGLWRRRNIWRAARESFADTRWMRSGIATLAGVKRSDWAVCRGASGR